LKNDPFSKNFDKGIITVQPLIFNGFEKIGLLMILIKIRQDLAEEKRSAGLATAGAFRSDNREQKTCFGCLAQNMFLIFIVLLICRRNPITILRRKNK